MNALLMDKVSFSVPARLDACSAIRDRVYRIALELPFTDRDRDDIRVAVGEAASNAVRHGCKDRPWADITVNCWTDADELGVEIRDDGPGFDPEGVSEPNFEGLPEGGMGIFYMRTLMDRVGFSFADGTRVILVKRFSPECMRP